MPDRFTFEVKGLSEDLRVARFAGHEGLSELFRFEILVVSEAQVGASDVIEQPALLTMAADASGNRFVHGIVSRFEMGDAGKKLTSYRLTLVPKAWRLLHRYDCRIFQELTAPAIIQKVLE